MRIASLVQYCFPGEIMSFVRTSLECVANYRVPFPSPVGEKSFEEVETFGLVWEIPGDWWGSARSLGCVPRTR